MLTQKDRDIENEDKNCLAAVFFFSLNVYSSVIDTILVKSKSMDKSIPNLIILPDSYDKQNENFPVLYLLHGAGGNYLDWSNRVPVITKYADKYDMIIVCPDGGVTSWYFDSPIDKSMKYETYITKELVPWIDGNYNTIAQKKGRAITGLSMGGHGAFYLSFRHQDIWGAAGSLSGGVDIRSFPNEWNIAKRLGNYRDNKENWEENTVINMVYLLDKESLKIIFECGVNDFFYEANKRLHEKMLQRNIPHDYTERPGRHQWSYWGNAIKYQLVFFDDFFKT